MESESQIRVPTVDSSYVLFNRQPSLHKMSMMSHRVKLMNYSSASLLSMLESMLTVSLPSQSLCVRSEIGWSTP